MRSSSNIARVSRHLLKGLAHGRKILKKLQTWACISCKSQTFALNGYQSARKRRSSPTATAAGKAPSKTASKTDRKAYFELRAAHRRSCSNYVRGSGFVRAPLGQLVTLRQAEQLAEDENLPTHDLLSEMNNSTFCKVAFERSRGATRAFTAQDIMNV